MNKQITIPTLSALLKEYEKGTVDMERILDFRVRFEHIRPLKITTVASAA